MSTAQDLSDSINTATATVQLIALAAVLFLILRMYQLISGNADNTPLIDRAFNSVSQKSPEEIKDNLNFRDNLNTVLDGLDPSEGVIPLPKATKSIPSFIDSFAQENFNTPDISDKIDNNTPDISQKIDEFNPFTS